MSSFINNNSVDNRKIIVKETQMVYYFHEFSMKIEQFFINDFKFFDFFNPKSRKISILDFILQSSSIALKMGLATNNSYKKLFVNSFLMT